VKKMPGDSIRNVLVDVYAERAKQDDRWGEQNHPDGTNLTEDEWRANRVKALNDFYVDSGTLTWRDILLEEVYEAFAESDLDRLREELVQVAAVAVCWVESIDRRRA